MLFQLNIDEICLLKKHKILNENVEFNRAPDLSTIHEVTGYVDSGVEKLFNLKRNFIRLFIGVGAFSSFQRTHEHFINCRIIRT